MNLLPWVSWFIALFGPLDPPYLIISEVWPIGFIFLKKKEYFMLEKFHLKDRAEKV